MNKKPTVTAHAGCCGTEDNSMESLIKAVEVGADILEFDLRFTAEGKPVLTHNLPATDECVSVDDAFAYLADKDIKVNIDAKETAHFDAVEVLIDKYGMRERCFFTGITEDFVAPLNEQFPTAVYYLNVIIPPVIGEFKSYITSLIKKIKDCGAMGLNCNYLTLTKKVTDAVHEAGLEVSAWTANDEAVIEKLIKMGVDNITSRIPDTALKLVNK